MLNKNKLLTGVVFPLMSLAIAVEPASAGFAGAAKGELRSTVAVDDRAVILAQAEAQAQPPAEEPNPEELIRKKRQQAQEAQPQAEPPKQQQEPAPEPRRQRPEPQAEQPAPQPRQREAQPEAPAPEPQQQRPRREPAQEAAPAEPQQQQERPRRAPPQEAAPAEQQQQQERPRRPERAQQPEGEGQQRPDRPRREPAQQAAPEQPAAQPPAAQAPENAEPKQKPADRRKQPVEEQAPEKKAEPAEKPVPEKKPAAPEPAAKDTPVPTEPPTPARPRAPEAQPNPAPGQQPSEQPRPEGQGNARPPVPPLPDAPTPPPQDGATSGQAPAGEPVPDQVATPQTEAPPMSKEQLDKAKAIAKDPSKTADTVILPVDKGAAVLDSDKEVERSGNRQAREERRREREQAGDYKVPTSDAEAQRAARPEGGAPPPPPVRMEAITSQQGERVDRRPQYERPDGVREWQPREGNRRDREDGAPIILQFGDRVVVRGDDNQRFIRDGGEPYYERLPGGRVRETVERRDGTQVVTIRNRYGDVIQRSRIDDRGREYVLFYAPELMEDPDRDYVYRDPGLDLPPMRLRIPVRDYIIDTSSDPDRDYYRFLEQPPVEPVERVYSLDEVRYSARIRDKVRRIDLDTITFATGSAEIPMAQARSLRKVADAINQALTKNPAETFLIEGHTDAVGSDESNLVLSDERAASVANVLTDVYGIPPENLATQGYGERFLKVQTLGPEQQNRRVTIRRVTPLVRPVAQN